MTEPRYACFKKRFRRLRESDHRFRKLLGIARDLGVRVQVAALPVGKLGFYRHQTREVWIDVDLAPSELLSTFAHEVAHAIYGHVDSVPEQEAEADRWAALFLIEDDEWHAYLEAHGGCQVAFLADCFGVDESVIQLRWEIHKQRIEVALCA